MENKSWYQCALMHYQSLILTRLIPKDAIVESWLDASPSDKSQYYPNHQYGMRLTFLCHSDGIVSDKSLRAAAGDAFRKLPITCWLIIPRLHPSWNIASANWSRIGPCLSWRAITRKKLVKDDASGSISDDSKRVWKHVRARSNASFFSSSLFLPVNAHAKTKEEHS